MDRGARSWNGALRALLELWITGWRLGFHNDVEGPVAFGRQVGVCIVEGLREDNGFQALGERYGWSVQGLGAQKALEATVRIGEVMGHGYALEFRWHDRPEASHPGAIGRVVVPRDERKCDLDAPGAKRHLPQLLALLRRGAERIAEHGGAFLITAPVEGEGWTMQMRRETGPGQAVAYPVAVVAEIGRTGDRKAIADGTLPYPAVEGLDLAPGLAKALEALAEGRAEVDQALARKCAEAVNRGCAEGRATWRRYEAARAGREEAAVAGAEA